LPAKTSAAVTPHLSAAVSCPSLQDTSHPAAAAAISQYYSGSWVTQAAIQNWLSSASTSLSPPLSAHTGVQLDLLLQPIGPAN